MDDPIAALSLVAERAGPLSFIFARFIGLLLIAPPFATDSIPLTVRSLFAVVLTAVLAPAQLIHASATPELAPWIAGLGAELAIGLSLGFAVQVIFTAIRFGGDMMGRIAGYAAGEQFDPDSGEMTGPTGELLHLIGLLILLIGNGHHHILATLQHSFSVIPLTAFNGTQQRVSAALDLGMGHHLAHGMALCFPVLFVVMLVTMAEGVVAKVLPQINILFMTFAVKIGVFLLVFYVGLPSAVAFVALVIDAALAFARAFLPLLTQAVG